MQDIKIHLNFERDNKSHTIESYKSRGGYRYLEKFITSHKPEEVVEIVKASKIRGRGGAGFPAGQKWSFLPKNSTKPAYLLCNADEGEPGTFKDRLIMEENPHQLVEGMIISSYAIRAAHSYVYIRGEYKRSETRLRAAVEEAYHAGYLGKNIFNSGYDCHLTIHMGAGAYVVGEETGLINSLEGKKGMPRLKPPFPALVGLFDCPTVVNNVETIAAVPYILEIGGQDYAKIGTENSTGTKLFSVSGHIRKPGVYEVPMGYPFIEFLNNECGGMMQGKALKCLIPGGSSTPVLTADEAKDLLLDYDSMRSKGTFLGSGGVIVIAEGTCTVKILTNLLEFYHHESCGQCTPCREGTGWAADILHRIEHGHGTSDDIENLARVSSYIGGFTICALGDAASMPIDSFVKKFRQEFEDHVKLKRCPYDNRFPHYNIPVA